MKKFLKFIRNLLIVFGVFFVIFLIWCFVSEDEDSSYTEGTQTEGSTIAGNTISGGNNSNGANTIGGANNNTGGSTNTNSGATQIITDSENKEDLRELGMIREPLSRRKGDGTDTVTILVYMNGSDLESDDGSATRDLQEMVSAGSADQVTVLVQTMGTKKWRKTYNIASDRSQRYEINGNGLKLVADNLGQLDCTNPKTLTDFIKWGTKTYPADRYILLFWDHGGGPVYGFGYDEWNSNEEACLSMDEMQTALRDAGTTFDMVGMDCCIMSCMELGCALYDYTDYLVLSEDFESGLGWYYTTWLKELYNNPSIETVNLGKYICDSMVDANELDTENGDQSIMAVIDESMMKVLYSSWVDFAYANEDELLGTNYSSKIKKKVNGRIHPRMKKKSMWDVLFSWNDVSMSDYYVTDIMAVAQNLNSDESNALSSAVGETLVYVRSSSGEKNLTGISVTLPYGDSEFYSNAKKVFKNSGMDEDYIAWLQKFTYVDNGSSSYYDYDDWDDSWDGWDSYDDDYDWRDYDWDAWQDWGYWFDEYEYYYDDDDECGYYYDDDYEYDDDYYYGDYYDEGDCYDGSSCYDNYYYW